MVPSKHISPSEDNNVAMAMLSMRCPFKFSGPRGEDPVQFVTDFQQFVVAHKLDEAQGIVALNCLLLGTRKPGLGPKR